MTPEKKPYLRIAYKDRHWIDVMNTSFFTTLEPGDEVEVTVIEMTEEAYENLPEM